MIRRRSALFVLVFPLAAAASAGTSPAYFGAPGVLYLDGIGPIYGGAAGAKGLLKSSAALAGFKSFGSVEGGGLALLGVPVSGGSLDAGFAVLERAEFTTQYGRGYEQDLLVDQVVDGFGFGARYSRETDPGRFSWGGGYSFSSVGFDSYKTRDGRTIPLSRKDLHAVNTNLLWFDFDARPLEDRDLLRLRGAVSAVAGRAAQSDMTVQRLALSGERRFARAFRASWSARFATVMILRDAGPGRADFECSKIADAGLRSDCSRLQKQLSDFVTESNARGTAPPLGGSRGLRSYREMRFKAAHTALWGIEFGWKPVDSLPLELAAFYDLGHASDSRSALLTRSRHSVGAGLRAALGPVPVRAEWAYGQEGGAAFLTLGAPW